jgi:hypothetical protein
LNRLRKLELASLSLSLNSTRLSTETNNLLPATLSGGRVGIGDAIGGVNKQNLLRAARPDGVLDCGSPLPFRRFMFAVAGST